MTYTQAQASGYFPATGGDTTTQLFVQRVAATLNVQEGNDSSCIAGTIAAANTFLAANPPGSGSSLTKAERDNAVALDATLDDYDNGKLCAPHRAG